MKIKPSMICCVPFVLLASVTWAKDVGKVDFDISCSASSQQAFNQALALAHNMMYVQSQEMFSDIIEADPTCGMAYWGAAFTQIHPLWGDSLSEQELKKGVSLLNQAKSQNLSEKESAFIEALDTYYSDWQDTTDKDRFKAWEKAQWDVYQTYSKEPEAVALYSLLHLATAPKSDKSYQHQKEAGKLLEKLHKEYPKHPAGFHYTIHAYDNPELAAKGEPYARKYDEIAPEVPHALHMPSHIFVRLGYWPETIDWNVRSAKAAKSQPMPDGSYSMHYAHALDYLMYAYMQKRQIAKAKEVLKELNHIESIQAVFASGYGIAAARARFYLEQELWQEAADLPLNKPSQYPWDTFPAALSMTLYAKGLGSIHTSNVKQTKAMIEQLENIHKELTSKNEHYWSVLIDAKIHALKSHLALETDESNALKLMQKAAELEDSLDKHPVTPAEIAPAREMLGDVLLEKEHYQEALQAYEACLSINPNRYHSLKGARKAAQELNNTKAYDKYDNQLKQLTS